MSRIAYVNGRYLPHRDAGVHIEDRGYQFADGVYEVIAVSGGRFVDEGPHLERLDRSMSELSLTPPMARPALRHVLREVVRRNGVRDGIVYMQITRGVAPRDHAFPKPAVPSALVVTARRMRLTGAHFAETGVRVITVPDLRWKRCDIKSVSLLPNVLAKQQAKDAGAFEAWMVREDGTVSEGTSTNAWIVTQEGELVTRRADTSILSGITRLGVMALAAERGLRLSERAFSVDEAKAAREAFLTSTTALVMPVVRIDDSVIGDGRPGPSAKRLSAIYHEAMARGGPAETDDSIQAGRATRAGQAMRAGRTG